MEQHGIITLAVALVAQLDRVSDYESEGQGFESLPAHQARFPKGNRAFLRAESKIFKGLIGPRKIFVDKTEGGPYNADNN